MKHQARKRFGQHFLTDESALEAIVRAIDPRPGEPMVEIGPGLGALTNPLVQRCRQLTVVELDRDLAARLRRRPELSVIEADVLTVDFRELADRLAAPPGPDSTPAAGTQAAAAGTPGGKLRLVGNLPYNISSPILFHLLPFADRVQDQHFMLQKEVVDRMAAGPGSKTYGRLSVMLQWRYAIEALFDVPPEAFDPPPQVDSAVVRMQPLDPTPAVDAVLLGELVAAAFSQRRKLLRHALGSWLAQRGHDAAALGFDLQRRAEEVPVADYLALAQAIGRG